MASEKVSKTEVIYVRNRNLLLDRLRKIVGSKKYLILPSITEAHT